MGIIRNNRGRLFHLLIFIILSEVALLILKSQFTDSSWPRNGVKPEPNTSLCSDKATKFGPNQKVVSYSFFMGSSSNSSYVMKRYVSMMRNNFQRVRQLYPGWVIRFYTNAPEDQLGDFRTLKDEPTVFICNVTNIPVIGNVNYVTGTVWRFLPMVDPTVHIFVVRDTDSLINARERSAVKQWEESDKIFHTMRDHPWHWSHPVLAGMWGGKTYLIDQYMRENLTSIFAMVLTLVLTPIFKSPRKTADQEFLRDRLYDPFKSQFMIHDSYFCQVYNDSIPFPEKRADNHFVGEFSYTKNNAKINVCPPACRPTYGRDWIYC